MASWSREKERQAIVQHAARCRFCRGRPHDHRRREAREVDDCPPGEGLRYFAPESVGKGLLDPVEHALLARGDPATEAQESSARLGDGAAPLQQRLAYLPALLRVEFLVQLGGPGKPCL